MNSISSNKKKEGAIYRRILAVAKIGLLLLFITTTTAFSLPSYSQTTKLSLALADVSIEEALNQIEAQTEFRFLYNKSQVDVTKHVSLSADSKSVTAVLDDLFAGTGIAYSVNDRQIVLTGAKSVATATLQQDKTVKGKIIDKKTKESLIGVSILVKGTTTGTITDLDGNYVLPAVAGESTLLVSYIGYKSQEIKVGNQTEINIALEESDQMLDELIVVGYGVQKKANLTGSVGHIKAEAIESRPITSISAALAGQIPGVTSIQTSGEPGLQTGAITIRGKNSINAASPLVIVDGVPGSMDNIAPADIASLTVLKDAASAAIYGVQAANGVILITTKRGSRGAKTQIDYSGNIAWTSPTARFNFLGSGDYAMLYNEATLNQNPNAQLSYTEDDIKKYRDGSDLVGHPNTDWYNEAMKPSAFEQTHYLSINGGTEKTNYNASIQYADQAALMDDNDYKRYNVRMNLDSQVSKWFAAGMSLSGNRGIRNIGWDSFSAVLGSVNRISPT